MTAKKIFTKVGGEHFVARLQAGIGEDIHLSEIPQPQRRPKLLELDEYKRGSGPRNCKGIYERRVYALGNN
jgi:hypothetical protein